jgi:hypothetical protein
MYVAPTPFALADGIAHRRTLIVPAAEAVPASFHEVGEVRRKEVDEVVGSYSFNLETNTLSTEKISNPNGGREHVFKAYRLEGDPMDPVTLRDRAALLRELDAVARSEGEDMVDADSSDGTTSQNSPTLISELGSVRLRSKPKGVDIVVCDPPFYHKKR